MRPAPFLAVWVLASAAAIGGLRLGERHHSVIEIAEPARSPLPRPLERLHAPEMPSLETLWFGGPLLEVARR